MFPGNLGLGLIVELLLVGVYGIAANPPIVMSSRLSLCSTL